MINKKIIINLRLKSFHKYYLNKFVLLSKVEAKRYNMTFAHIFLPKKIEKFTVLKSPHVDKKARDQYEKRIYNRTLKINVNLFNNDFNLYAFLNNLQILAIGVGISAKYTISYNII